MTVLLNNQAVNVPVGSFESGPINLPEGTRALLVTYDCESWPVVSDGSITMTLRISDNNGSNYRDEWSDVIQHVELKRAGAPVSTASFGISLQAPFGAQSKLKVGIQSSVAFSTHITVQAV